MRIPKQKTRLIFAGIAVLIAAIAAGPSIKKYFFASKDKRLDPLGYGKIIKPEDRQPLASKAPPVSGGRFVKLPILMYHHIGDPPQSANAARLDMTVPLANFKKQVEWLKQQGFVSIKLADLLAFSQGKFLMPKKPIIFTFDDGYEDALSNAVPVLKQNGFTGSFAVITQYPNNRQGDNFYASWQKIASAYELGMEIVSHTRDHFDGKNPKYSRDFVAKNLQGSIRDIQDHLNFKTQILIYPYGHYTDEYLAQAKAAGFKVGLTVHEGLRVNLDELTQVPRVRVHGKESLEEFIKKVEE